MANYDFENILSPLDFEHLVKDLLSRELEVELMAFAEGKDKGIDLRYSQDNDSKIIVQCKRSKYINKKLLEEEVEKVAKLSPEKYYFVVSSDVSVEKVDLIKSIFSTWMTGDENIYSRNKLNGLLDKYPDIQQKNYKLWLNSSSIFSTLINQHLFERSKALVNSIQKYYKFYVRNQSINDAIDLLNEHNFVIISGIPGIGKTTLAKLLLWEYLQKDFEVIEIRKIIEGEQFLIENSESKQVFYFDDFLGENFLKFDVIEGRSYDLVLFINRIINSKNKILIMTTREYILKQAKEKYAKLNTGELDIYKYTLDLNNYTKRIKTLILYNHLYYSNVSQKHIKDIIDKKAYKRIINHKNYSPRIIEQMTIKLTGIPPNEYSEAFIENLNNPFGIWDRAFKSEISEGSKFTLFILLSMGAPILLSELRKALVYFYENSAQKNSIDFKPLDFKNYIKEQEDSFITLNLTNKGTHFVDFQNPSIKDFLLSIIKDDKEIVKIILSSSFYFNQLLYSINYLSSNFKNDSEIKKIISSIIIERFNDFERFSTIIIGLEFRENLKEIDILYELKDYLAFSKNKSLEKYLFEKFETLELKKLYRHEEKKYISFYSNFKDKLSISIYSIIENVFNNITWFENVRNFTSLKSISELAFSDFVKSNQAAIDDKLSSAIKKDIEFSDTKSSLEELKFELEDEIENLKNITSFHWEDVSEEIDDKISDIEEMKKEEVKKELSKDNIDKNVLKNDSDFDEDEYFKIELFR
ncbi:MAG: restriction endonuclease [Bacteroidales bacterium]|nr:restriction endonuclease [Bacteroidales bacterium]